MSDDNSSLTGAASPAVPTESQERPGAELLFQGDHRTLKHPWTTLYLEVWPDGLRTSFPAMQGHFGVYTFRKDLLVRADGGWLALSCPGSLEPLPIRVRLSSRGYQIEWLPGPPSRADVAAVATYEL